jgi:hypothetical protein
MDSPLVTNGTILQLTVILYDHRKLRLVVSAGSIALIRPAPLSTRPPQEREGGYHQAQQCGYGPESAVDDRQRPVIVIAGRGV